MKLYNGEVELVFNEKAHRYKVDGKFVEGVTTILSKVIAKDGLIQWAVDLCLKENDRLAHRMKKEAGADVGSQVHKWIESYLKDAQTVDLSGEALKAAMAFLAWEQDNKPEYIFSEKVVYSRAHKYAGTADVAFELDGKRYLADFKTANPRREFKNGKYTGKLAPYPEHFIQCAAYNVAYTEECGDDFDAYMIIYITKSGELHTFETDKVQMCKDAWVGGLTLARALKHLT